MGNDFADVLDEGRVQGITYKVVRYLNRNNSDLRPVYKEADSYDNYLIIAEIMESIARTHMNSDFLVEWQLGLIDYRTMLEKFKTAIDDLGLSANVYRSIVDFSFGENNNKESESLKAEQNKRSKGPQSPVDLEELKALKEKIKLTENELKSVEEEYERLMMTVPNIPTEDTPVGKDELENKVLRKWGKIKSLDFKPKEHWELGEALDLIDSERGSKVSGARFSYLKRGLVLMEFAIIQYGLSVLTDERLLKKIIKTESP